MAEKVTIIKVKDTISPIIEKLNENYKKMDENHKKIATLLRESSELTIELLHAALKIIQ